MDDVDNREFRCELVEAMYEELPAPKKKVSTQYGQGTTGEVIVRHGENTANVFGKIPQMSSAKYHKCLHR